MLIVFFGFPNLSPFLQIQEKMSRISPMSPRSQRCTDVLWILPFLLCAGLAAYAVDYARAFKRSAQLAQVTCSASAVAPCERQGRTAT